MQWMQVVFAQHQGESKQLKQQQITLRAEVAQQQEVHEKVLQRKAQDTLRILRMEEKLHRRELKLLAAAAQNEFEQLNNTAKQSNSDHKHEMSEAQAAHDKAMVLLHKVGAAMEAMEAASTVTKNNFDEMKQQAADGEQRAAAEICELLQQSAADKEGYERANKAITVQVAALAEQLIVWKAGAEQKELHQIKVSEEAAAAHEKAMAEAAAEAEEAKATHQQAMAEAAAAAKAKA